MKKIISLLIVSIFVLSGLGAVGQVLNKGINDISDYKINIDLEIPDLITHSKIIKGNSFSSIEFEDEGSTIVVGEARLPVINRMIEIPYGADPKLMINYDKWTERSLSDFNLDFDIEPVQPAVIKNLDRDSFEFTQSSAYYTTNRFFNTDKAKILETGIIRGHKYALIQIQAVQYNPATEELKILEDIDLDIIVDNADLKETQNKVSKYKMEAYDNILDDMILNYGEFEPTNYDYHMTGGGYLVICDDGFTGALSNFVTWKEAIGFDVTVTTLSQIPGGPTRDNIQDYIQDAYDNWSPAIGYVLLAGDTGQIPAFNGQSSNTATDLYYSTTDGSDYMPDLLIGRFSGSQVSHITAMVDKTVGYEQGYWPDDDFLSKGAFMAGNDNYQITEGTHNYCIDNYFDPKNWQCDKLYEVTYGANTQDVRDSLGNGRAAAIYSGHGSTYSWADGPSFSQSDVSGLTNTKKLSFVCSHACVTGNYEVSECFGETWIRTPNKAAIIFWGSSANTLWDEDDVLQKLTLANYFGGSSVGQMTNIGKIGLHGHYGGGGYSKYYMECYNIMGDPSVEIGSSQSSTGGGGDVIWTPPRVGINRPSYGSTVNNTVEFSGYAYGFEGPIKYVMIKVGPFDWVKANGKDEWSYTWDSNSVEDGEILVQAVSIDTRGFQSGTDYLRVNVLNNPPDPEPKIPDLFCEGELSWNEIDPGEIVTGAITLENIGDPESLLDWEITEWPEDWGRWTINPSIGEDLTPEDGIVNIQINLEAPTEYEHSYIGQIKIENLEDADDYEIIDVNLTTIEKKSKNKTPPVLNWIINLIRERFPKFYFPLENFI